MATDQPRRRCGPCVACCTTMGVDEIDKPERTRCKHQSRRGCRIYSRRPNACRSFECGWLGGMGTKHDRPDRLGVVLSAYDLGKGRTLHIAEVRPGAADSQRVAEIGEVARDEGIVDQVVIVRADGRRRLHILATDERIEWGGPREPREK